MTSSELFPFCKNYKGTDFNINLFDISESDFRKNVKIKPEKIIRIMASVFGKNKYFASSNSSKRAGNGLVPCKIDSELSLKSISTEKRRFISNFFKAEKGDSEAYFSLALAFLVGSGFSQNKRLAVRLFYNAAVLKDPIGQFYYGLCLVEGFGDRDATINPEIIEKGLQLLGTAVDPKIYMRADGATLLKQTAEKGLIASNVALGQLALQNQSGDLNDAIIHFEVAAKEKYRLAEVYLSLLATSGFYYF